jgi:hypothetical protein
LGRINIYNTTLRSIMLRSTETCLSADDIPIRCTVRHSRSSHSNNKSNGEDFTEMEDMMCTMRVWHETKQPRSAALGSSLSSGAAPPPAAGGTQGGPAQRTGRRRGSLSGFENTPLIASATAAAAATGGEFEMAGPELILTPISITGMVEQQHHNICCADSFGETPRLLSQRFTSFGSASFEAPVRRYSLSTNQSPTRRIGNATIALKDILMIDVHGGAAQRDESSPENRRALHRINIITISNGLYEFTMDSANGRELLLAFLKANIPKKRMNDQEILLSRSPSNLTLNTSHSNRSYDVEAFTATRMSERLQSESIGEKVQRRVHRLVSGFEECKYSRASFNGLISGVIVLTHFSASVCALLWPFALRSWAQYLVQLPNVLRAVEDMLPFHPHPNTQSMIRISKR